MYILQVCCSSLLHMCMYTTYNDKVDYSCIIIWIYVSCTYVHSSSSSTMYLCTSYIAHSTRYKVHSSPTRTMYLYIVALLQVPVCILALALVYIVLVHSYTRRRLRRWLLPLPLPVQSSIFAKNRSSVDRGWSSRLCALVGVRVCGAWAHTMQYYVPVD